ncbi:MAG: OsmC family protein [Rhizobiaceae bacterium]
MKIASKVPISIKGQCISHGRTDVEARGKTIIIDEPPQRGGTDLGMSPLETFFSSYCGCINVVANVIIEEQGLDVQISSVDVLGKFLSAAFTGKKTMGVPFEDMKLIITAKVNCSDEELAKVKDELSWRCPISATFHAAGMDLQEEWVLT